VLELRRDGLATLWLSFDPDDPGRIIERRHCEHRQPHRAGIVMCGLVDTTVMLGDDLAVADRTRACPPIGRDLSSTRHAIGLCGEEWRAQGADLGARLFHAYDAKSAGEVEDVYKDIGSSVGYEKQEKEITSRFAGIAMLLTFLAGAASIAADSRIP
jgi:hypothetical protein